MGSVDKYQYDHRPGKHRPRQVLVVLTLTLFVICGIGYVVWRDLQKNKESSTAGSTHTVLQAGQDAVDRLLVNDTLFSMELPGDWKELSRRNDVTERSITWQSTKKSQEGRSLKLYIDTVPSTLPINRLLPVMAQGNGLTLGDISENCATFTQGGTLNVHEAAKLKDAPAKWNKVDFICDLPRVNDNEVGTGSAEGINTVTLKGPAQGSHKYFFLFTDHNNQANYEIFYNALRSFKAK
jgi:hypothetical protein